MKKQIALFLFGTIFFSQYAFSQQLSWPLTEPSVPDETHENNNDVVTSAFGPRILNSSGTNFDIHYGMDLNRSGGGKGDQIYAPANLSIERINFSSTRGYYIEARFFDSFIEDFSRIQFLHLEQDPRSFPYNLQENDIINKGNPIPGAFVGNTGLPAGAAAHLHLTYFPDDKINQNPRTDSENPIQLLPYEYKDDLNNTVPYSASDPQLEMDGQDTWFSFTAFIPSKRLDLTRIEVSFNGFDKNGFPHTHNDESGSYFDPIIESQQGFVEGFEQEIGVVDFHERIGLDINSENNTFNGVKIEPAELNNFSGSGYQPNDHSYKISFKLDNRVLREILVGGLYNVTAEL